MKRKISCLLLWGGLSLVGCGSGTSPSGDITLAWSFDGEDCSGAGVATVGVQIFDAQGNQIVSDSTACTDESATYTDFAPGDYSYTLTGFSPGGNAIYGASGGLTVDSGNNDVSVDLTAETGS